jgi:hypothetical protein
MHRESDEERIEDALRARASLAGDNGAGGEDLVGPGWGSGYHPGSAKDFGEDFAEDDELLDEGLGEDDDDEAEEATVTS